MSIIKWDSERGADVRKSVEGPPAAVQRVFIRLNTKSGEYILDDRVGLDWDKWLQSMPFPVEEAKEFIFAAIQDTPGVEKITGLDMEVDPEDASVDIQLRLLLDGEEEPRNYTVHVGI